MSDPLHHNPGETVFRKLTDEERFAPPKGSCAVCSYYQPEERVCRRYPETFYKLPSDWCGEFKERPVYRLERFL